MTLNERARSIFYNQEKRCYNVNDKDYPTYGAKGIKIEYSFDQFFDWYKNNIFKFNGLRPSVGRIDHSKNYSLDNIEIQEMADNIKERNARCGNPAFAKRRRVTMYLASTMAPIKTFESIKDAAKFSNSHGTTVVRICKNKQKQLTSGFTFRYAEEAA